MPVYPSLLPAPRSIKLTGGFCDLSKKINILLKNERPQALFHAANLLRESFSSYSGLALQIYAGRAPNLNNIAITLQVASHQVAQPQGYRITIQPFDITIDGHDEAGVFYGCCTMLQLIQFYGSPHPSEEILPGLLPCMEITDWPDFLNRGVMLDISRDKVPTMETLLDLVDMLASWKINQIQLYTEHTFAYQQHPEVWAQASPMTGEEIMRLDAFCKERYIELVPNQNSFGHLEHWLSLPRYRPLAEAPEGFDFPWGHQEGPFSLCPLDEGSLELLTGLYDELLPHFSSHQLNVGCDETFDLGQGRSKNECERVGTGRVYLDFLLKIYQQVKKRSHRMQFWGDIIMAHPELVPELPKDSLALEWGYEADHPFEQHGEKFKQAGLAFYVCPGTSSWNSIAGRTDNCLGNLANAARNGIKNGADGYLVTDWGDNGHWQALPVSYLGFAAGAAFSWCYQANQSVNLPGLLSQYAFQDPSGEMGRMAYDLGNIYHLAIIEPPNASAFFHILQHPIEWWKDYWERDIALRVFDKTLEAIHQISLSVAHSTAIRKDHDLLQREFKMTISLLEHACKRGLFIYRSGEYSSQFLLDDLDKIMEEYRLIWLERNRPGGLVDSLSYFAKIKKAYQ
jgi:hexosaminidase